MPFATTLLPIFVNEKEKQFAGTVFSPKTDTCTPPERLAAIERAQRYATAQDYMTLDIYTDASRRVCGMTGIAYAARLRPEEDIWISESLNLIDVDSVRVAELLAVLYAFANLVETFRRPCEDDGTEPEDIFPLYSTINVHTDNLYAALLIRDYHEKSGEELRKSPYAPYTAYLSRFFQLTKYMSKHGVKVNISWEPRDQTDGNRIADALCWMAAIPGHKRKLWIGELHLAAIENAVIKDTLRSLALVQEVHVTFVKATDPNSNLPFTIGPDDGLSIDFTQLGDVVDIVTDQRRFMIRCLTSHFMRHTTEEYLQMQSEAADFSCNLYCTIGGEHEFVPLLGGLRQSSEICHGRYLHVVAVAWPHFWPSLSKAEVKSSTQQKSAAGQVSTGQKRCAISSSKKDGRASKRAKMWAQEDLVLNDTRQTLAHEAREDAAEALSSESSQAPELDFTQFELTQIAQRAQLGDYHKHGRFIAILWNVLYTSD